MSLKEICDSIKSNILKIGNRLIFRIILDFKITPNQKHFWNFNYIYFTSFNPESDCVQQTFESREDYDIELFIYINKILFFILESFVPKKQRIDKEDQYIYVKIKNFDRIKKHDIELKYCFEVINYESGESKFNVYVKRNQYHKLKLLGVFE